MRCVSLPIKDDNWADGTGRRARVPPLQTFLFPLISHLAVLVCCRSRCLAAPSSPRNTASFFSARSRLAVSQSFALLAPSTPASNMSLKVGHHWVICCTHQMIIQNCRHISVAAGCHPKHTIACAARVNSHRGFLIIVLLNRIWSYRIISQRRDTVFVFFVFYASASLHCHYRELSVLQIAYSHPLAFDPTNKYNEKRVLTFLPFSWVLPGSSKSSLPWLAFQSFKAEFFIIVL